MSQVHAEYLKVALIRLGAARREYSRLTAGSPDLSAVVVVNAAFDQLEDEMRTFALHHYGIGARNVWVSSVDVDGDDDDERHGWNDC